ncbi:MAG: DUF4345 domain-containing protein [Rhodospirillaceae bacterium]
MFEKDPSMALTRLEKIALSISGITALGIGGFILVAPHTFYASYGITLGNDPSLLSELRAPAAGLAALGFMMLAGIARPAWSQLSISAALIVFLAFPAGRLVGLVADGLPSGGIIGALIFELATAALCLAAFHHRLWPRASARNQPIVT